MSLTVVCPSSRISIGEHGWTLNTGRKIVSEKFPSGRRPSANLRCLELGADLVKITVYFRCVFNEWRIIAVNAAKIPASTKNADVTASPIGKVPVLRKFENVQ